MTQARGRAGRALVVTLALVLLAGGLTGAATAAAPRAAAAGAPVADEVRAELAASGQASFWVRFERRPELTEAAATPNWADRGRAVVSELRRNADDSQAAVRDLLAAKGVAFTPFWIVNAIKVTAGTDLVDQLAQQPGVVEIAPDRSYELAQPTGGPPAADGEQRAQAVEWNVDRIGAPDVWADFGTRGEGIVVGSIDSGVQFDHPALVGSYRGNLGGGVFDHDYNWYDPMHGCGDPSAAPCDDYGYGTRTMGTIVGDDGAGNQIGVAPGVRWMTARGCEYFHCPEEAFLAAGQWMLAPTDLSGANPRPDLRPNVVNGFGTRYPNDRFLEDVVDAWVAAGIFPVFPAGDEGPFCQWVGSPADYQESYAVGAFDRSDRIAPFSSRGSSWDDPVKPDIAAPGADVRTSVVGGGYEVLSGTTLAAGHVTGTVALLWSAAPAIAGDVAQTRALLDQAALDRPDSSCGGDPGDNHVWGEGALDAFGAVELAPRGAAGRLAGTVTGAGGAPVAGARVHVAGSTDRTAVTDAAGAYHLTVAPGDYAVDVSAFGHLPVADEVTVTEGTSTILDVSLPVAPTHTVSGVVQDHHGTPLAGVTVNVLGVPISSTTTGPDGTFRLPDVPEGTYSIEAVEGRCLGAPAETVVVDGDESIVLTLSPRPDAAGYTCEAGTAEFVRGNTVVPLYGFDVSTEIDLPFPFTFYGQVHDRAHISSCGFLSFERPPFGCVAAPIPNPWAPHLAIHAFSGEGVFITGESGIRTEIVGEAPHRQFVIEWRNVAIAWTSSWLSFEVILSEDGDIETRYDDIRIDGDLRSSNVVGIENGGENIGLQYSYAQVGVQNGLSVRFHAPPSGFVEGRVTDGAGGPLAGADIRVLEDGVEVRSTRTAGNGTYLVRVPPGTYTVEAAFNGQGTETTTVVVDEAGETEVADFDLAFARIGVAPAAIDLVVPPGATRVRTVTIANDGQVPLEYEIGERPMAPGSAVDAPWSPADRVLLVRDILPWDSSAMTQVLDAEAVAHDVVSSDELDRIDLTAYQAVIISNGQDYGFNQNLRAAMPLLSAFVEQGGLLWVGAAMAFSPDLDGTELPGGATIESWGHETNDVADPDHPAMAGVPDPFGGDWGTTTSFDNLPAGTHVIARGLPDLQPTLVEYDLGIGTVLASGQYLEHDWDLGQPGGRILENLVPYVDAYETFADVPWLTVAPTSGTVAPGASQPVAVTVDTTGLVPGVHGANVIVRSSDPFTRQVVVPVTVVVPAYQAAVDVGATRPFTDAAGDGWAADRRYTAGAWGYTGSGSTAQTTTRAIAGTDEDLLFQTARGNPVSYRFDALPAGTYEVDLRFAETNGRRPGRRSADVYLDDELVLPSHDIAAEVGTYAADRHTMLVEVTDGRLDVRFVPLAGFGAPIVNALRVTHRPDR